MPDETVRWMLSNAATRVVCTERIASGRIRLDVSCANLPLKSHSCVTPEQATRWADQIRLAWEASGWTPTENDR